jgi:hypothetical protein
VRAGIVEAFVITTLFGAAIAALTVGTGRQPVSVCSVMSGADQNVAAGAYTEPMQSRWLEE